MTSTQELPSRPALLSALMFAVGLLAVLPQGKAQSYTFFTLAGEAPPVGSFGTNDGGYVNGTFRRARGVAVDNAGNVYVADWENNTIRKVTPAGAVTTLAGLARQFGNTDGIGSAARFQRPEGVAVDSVGNIFVADSNAIRKITSAGLTTTLTAGIPGAVAIAVDDLGNAYVACLDHTIRKVTPAGVITTLAGLAGSVGNADGMGSTARFNYPKGVALDREGNIYVADMFNNKIRKMTPGGVVTTLAGSGAGESRDGTGITAGFSVPEGVAVDGAGNVFVADSGNNTIRKVTPAGVVTTLAGLAGFRGSTDGTGSTARFYNPQGLAVDSAGNLYVGDADNFTIRKVTPAGAVTTLAGASGGLGGADSWASAARFYSPVGLAVDGAGNAYMADNGNHTIRKVSPAGVATTLAGLAALAGSADGTGSEARFRYPSGVAVDRSGNVYVLDSFGTTIRKVSSAGMVSTLAGRAMSSGSTDGIGSIARFAGAASIATDGDGNLYVADRGNHTIRKITPAGVVTTLAGLAGTSGNTDGALSVARFREPTGVAVDIANNVYVADSLGGTLRIIAPAGLVTTLAGPGVVSGVSGLAVDGSGNLFGSSSGNIILKITPAGVVTTLAGLRGSQGSSDGTGSDAKFYAPNGLAIDSANNVYVADSGNSTIRLGLPMPTVVVNQPLSVAVTVGSAASFSVGVSSALNLDYQWRTNGVSIPDATNTSVTLRDLKLEQSGTVDVIIKHGNAQFLSKPATLIVGLAPVFNLHPLSQSLVEGSNVTLTVAAAATPNAVIQWYRDGVAISGATGTNLVVTLTNGNGASFHAVASNILGTASSAPALVVAVPPGMANFLVGRSDGLRTVSTLAGLAGGQGSTDGVGSIARFFFPSGTAVDSASNVYVAELGNHTIRKVTPARVVSTLAGQAGVSGAAEGTGSAARFNGARGIAVDVAGNVYVADAGNHTIRKITLAGLVSTLAGQTGNPGSTDGMGSMARFVSPSAVAIDNAGNVYVADAGNHTIRKITPVGVVSTLAGQAGVSGSTDGTSSAARFNSPSGVAVDNSGNVFVSDRNNYAIRKVSPSGAVSTLAGLVGVSGSTDGTGSSARFNSPGGVAVDNSGYVYVADQSNGTIRQITPVGVVSTLAGLAGNIGSTDGTSTAARFYGPSGISVDSSGNVYVGDQNNHTIRKISATTRIRLDMPAYGLTANPVTLQSVPITLQISASDPTGLTYQWAMNGVAISGATAATYVITTPQTSHSGLYSVTVSRGAESVSLQQYLSVVPVLPQPNPAGDYVRIGSTLTVSALGTSNLVPNESGQGTTYRWAKDGVLLPGFENVPVLNFNVEESDAGLYSVQHYQGDRLVFSPGYRLRPLAVTVITNQPVSASVISPAGTNFTVGASSSLLSYQWYFNGTPLAGATNATLSVTNTGAVHAGDYYAIVSNPVSSATSGVARLTVNFVPSPSITNTPATYVARRTGFTLGGSATGTGPISYQWLRNGTAITGATGTSLSVGAGELTSGNYSYSLRASSPYGTNTASFTVQVVNGFRTVPATYWPGQPVAVAIHYGPSATSANHAYTETLPTTGVSELAPDAVNTAGLPVGYHLTGRTVKLVASNISDNGVWDPVQGTVKWGPFFDTTPRTLRYTLVPPLGWTNSINLTGALSEDSVTTANLNNTIVLNRAHPADNGPATDQLLNIFEVAAYAAAWRNSRAWLVAPTPIDQNFLTSAGAIWKSGEYYQIVGGTPPANWQSAPLPAGMVVSNYAQTFLTQAAASPLGVAVRTTSPVPGATNGALNMTITATPAASIGVFLMEEQLPPGWTASNISNGGFFDANFNKLKWGPLYSSAPTVYSYTAVPPAGARGVHAFTGLAGFDGAIINIAGQSEYSLEAAPIAPYVLVQPVGSTVNSGASASFGVVAGGTAPLTYQWRRNGFNVAGATNATLTFTNVTTARNGNYDVVISSAGGSVTSFPATLTVLAVSFNGMMVFGDSLSDTGNSPAGPADQYFNGRWSNGSLWEEILAPKIGVTFDPSLNYAVADSETGDLATQVASVGAVNGQLCTIWSGGNDFIHRQRDGVGIDDFVWTGIINTAVNNITSAISSLYAKGARSFLVLNLPDMGQLPGTRQNAPAMMTYAGQKTVQFNTALANALTTLQGQKAGSSIKLADVYGRVNQILAAPGTFGFTQTTVGALQDGALGDKSFTGPGANYLFWDEIHPTTKGHAEISKAAEVALGIFTSTVTAPVITQQPQGATAAAGSRVLLGVGATGTAPLTYQWRRNGSPVAGATGAMLILANVQAASAGTYDAIVSNSAGSVTSSAVSVTVTVPAIAPLLTSQPLSRTVVAGSNVTFSVTATGTPPLAYQWFRNGLPVPGASAAVLNLAGVNRAVSGVYTVGVTNGGGGLLSSNAFLRVLVPQRFQPPMRLGDGRVRLVFGDNGGGAFQASDATNFIVYASTEATGRNVSWAVVTNSLVLTNGQFMVEDSGAAGKPRRFYFIVDGDGLNFITDPDGH